MAIIKSISTAISIRISITINSLSINYYY